ncbi:MAG: hypothetical protein HY270_04885 [Deltaproteobacteria bacterium]|nr:hypothetical protein [Deltaproteobacteria bacterium]
MNATEFCKFLEALGHRVIGTPSAHWYDVNRFFFQGAPPHLEYQPDQKELRSLLRQGRCFGVRFATPISCQGMASYQIVCDNRSYGLEALSGNVRSKVRRGLKRCTVGAVDFSVLATAGRKAHGDTLARQGRDGVLDGERWDRFWAAAAATPGFEAWGAWNGDTLAAFLVSVAFGDSVEFMLARSCTDELGAYPNNALIYTVTEEMLIRRGLREVTFGLEALEPVTALDEFKFGMGFSKRPLRQRVFFHPVLGAMLRVSSVRALVRRYSVRRGQDAGFWRKAAGLLRFAEEGGW